MKTQYEHKAEFHFKEHQLALTANKPKAAKFHFSEYIRYKKLLDDYIEFVA